MLLTNLRERPIGRAGRRLVSISASQVAATFVAAVSGLLVWVIAARLVDPAALGNTSRVVSLATLVSALIAAGLGQYLLGVLPTAARPARPVAQALMTGSLATVVVAAAAGVLAVGELGYTGVILLAAFALTVTLTNLQDAVYICAGSSRDLARKAVAIAIARVATLLLPGALLAAIGVVSAQLLIALLTVPQLIVAALWLRRRLPKFLTAKVVPPARLRRQRALAVGYAYSITGAAVVWGTPAILTNSVAPESAAIFYAAWIVAGMIAAFPAAIANALVGSQAEVSRTTVPVVLLMLLAAAGLIAAGLALFGPLIATLFGADYAAIADLLPILALGQVASGAAVVLVAYLRLAAKSRHVFIGLLAWACGSFVVPVIVGLTLGLHAFAWMFVVGSVAAAGTGGFILTLTLWRRSALVYSTSFEGGG